MSLNITKAKDVVSSTIKKIAHTDAGDLVITFNNGTDYLYKSVPTEVYESLEKAESVGKAFHSMIKNKYETIKLVVDLEEKS